MRRKKEWWQDFFLKTYHRVQRDQFPEETNLQQAAFIEKALQLTPGARVLDVPCGQGRLAMILAQRGYRMTGVDFNPAALKDAARISRQRKLQIHWVRRDMRRLSWRNQFDGAFCFFGSFGYFDDAGNSAFLKAVARTLKPGGRILVEGNCAETLFPKFQPRGWGRQSNAIIFEERSYDYVNSRVESDWTIALGGRMHKHHISMRIYTFRELCELFAAAGFKDMTGYDTATRNPFKWGASRLSLVGTRK
jgi:SAM-dependent methyltransferase